jgi:OmpA-OmpF porin, OOP family
VARLIDMVRTVITPDVVKTTTVVTGESEEATRKTINAAIPSVLAGTLELGSTQAGAERLAQMISDGGYGAETVSGFGHMIGDVSARESLERSGGHLLTSLFGGRSGAIEDAVADTGSVRKSSASLVLRLVAPLVLGAIGRQIHSQRLDARGLMNMLINERGPIMADLPHGVANALGFDRELRAEERLVEHEPERTIHVMRRSRIRPAVLAALAVLTLLFFLTRNRESDVVRVERQPTAEIESPQLTPTPAPQTSVQFSELDAYMSGPKDQPGRVFILEGVTFDTESSRLKAESKEKLKELAAILKEHPDIRVRLEGHTNEMGGKASNRRLSLDRANSVKSELVSNGASAGSIDTKGLGSEPMGQPTEGVVLVVVRR